MSTRIREVTVCRRDSSLVWCKSLHDPRSPDLIWSIPDVEATLRPPIYGILSHILRQRRQCRFQNAPGDLVASNRRSKGNKASVVRIGYLQFVEAEKTHAFPDPTNALPVAVDDAVAFPRLVQMVFPYMLDCVGRQHREPRLDIFVALVCEQVIAVERAFQFDERLGARGAEDLGFLGIGPKERPLAVVVVVWVVFGRSARKGKHPEAEKSQANGPFTFSLVLEARTYAPAG